MEKTPITSQSGAPVQFVGGFRMGFAVVAVAMAEKIGVVDFLNARVAWDPRRCKVSPGERLLALIIGCLVDPMALYRLEEFYTHLDGAVLVGAGRQAHDFNDEVRGRALVKLFKSQVGCQGQFKFLKNDNPKGPKTVTEIPQKRQDQFPKNARINSPKTPTEIPQNR